MMLTPGNVRLVMAYSSDVCAQVGTTSCMVTSSFTKLNFQPPLKRGPTTFLALFGNVSTKSLTSRTYARPCMGP